MRVLLADDDPVSRCLVRGQLVAGGYEVVTATTGEEALRSAVLDGGPDLLILDWMMPGLHGPQVIERLRALQPDRYRYAILLTRRDGASDVLDGFESGADDFVRKPCDPRELVARVRVGQRLLDLQARLMASNQALAQLANRDALTALPNRRSLLETLEAASLRSRSLGRPLGAAMIDIDFFKRVNDVHGHAAGDAVIRAVADRMRGSLREASVFGRFGGEEFLLVEPDADRPTLELVAGRLCQAVRAHPIATETALVDVTVSIGIACRDADDGLSDADLIRLADEALYQAKESGRDRVCTAWSVPTQRLTGTEAG